MGKEPKIKRGDIFYAELYGIENQQIGTRPVIIYSNNTNNRFAPTVQVIPLSSELKELRVHVLIEGFGLREPSMALLEQFTTINKTQLREKVGSLSSEYMIKIDKAADLQFGRKSYIKQDDPFKVA